MRRTIAGATSLLLLTGTVGLAACQTNDDSSSSASSSSSTQALVAPSATISTGTCHAKVIGGNWLPDKKCTPGLVNRKVTQSNIHSTICVSGWSDKQRKTVPTSYYAINKVKSIKQYGYYAGSNPAQYEFDHLVPISVGGNVTDVRNLWAEKDPTPKDVIEAKVHAAVCAGRMTLAAARKGFQSDWTKIKVPVKTMAVAHASY